jgi:hypothetical protein
VPEARAEGIVGLMPFVLGASGVKVGRRAALDSSPGLPRPHDYFFGRGLAIGGSDFR